MISDTFGNMEVVMKRRRVVGWFVVTALVLLGGGGWLWWRSHLTEQTTLQGVARFQGDALGDISVSGVMTFHQDEGINVYDWDGYRRDLIPLVGISDRPIPSGYAWFDSETFKDSWPAADAGAYTRHSMPDRQVSPDVTLVRFSPDGQSIGCLAFQFRQLEVLVRRDGRTRWRRTFPVVANGLITGHKHLDLLISNDERVFIYLPIPSPVPIMAVTKDTVQTKNLQQPFQALITGYQRSLLLQQTAPAVTRSGGIHSPDGRYNLTFQRMKELPPQNRSRAGDSNRPSGLERLTVSNGSGAVLASYTAKTVLNDDHPAIILPFLDRMFQHSGEIYFSPEGSRLLFEGDTVGWFNEWAIYRY